MSLVIRAAARMLPASIRDRYREQWLADARDATEAGLRPASIALAAVTFAFSYDRPLPVPRALTPELAQGRARLAAALALSAGLLGLAGFARLWGSGRVTGNVGYDLLIELTETLLLLFAVVGSIAAVAIVTRTRAISARVRVAVWLLVLAATSPLAQLVIDGFPLMRGDMFVTFGRVAYIPAAIAVVVALRLLWTGVAHPETRPRPSARPVVLSALTVLAAGALCFAQAAIAWAARTPIVWSWLPGTATTMDEDGTVVQTKIYPTQADHAQWIALKDQFELTVTIAFVAYAVVVVATVAALVVLAVTRRPRPLVLASAAVAILLVGGAALLWRLDLNLAVPVVAPESLFAAGRLLIVGVVLYAVGGLRYAARVRPLSGMRHRHDVEGAV